MKRGALALGLSLALASAAAFSSCGGTVSQTRGTAASDGGHDAEPNVDDATVTYDVLYEDIVPFDVTSPIVDAALSGCDPNTPFAPTPWARPTPFSDTCSTQQILDYYDCLTTGTGDCSSFRAVAANASCLACLETDVAAPEHGPMITVNFGMIAIVQVNLGGCEAALDGDTSNTSCGEKIDVVEKCQLNDCGGCPDFPNGPIVTSCVDAAFSAGSCSTFMAPAACHQELDPDGGVAAVCGRSLIALLTEWCNNPAFAD